MNEDRMRDWIIEHLRPSAAQMSRDTQFQGFAKALLAELLQGSIVEVRTPFQDDWREEWESIIARWAYDLVEHSTRYHFCGDKYYRSLKEKVESIPDMTELPKEQE